jgi:hypothetical protein
MNIILRTAVAATLLCVSIAAPAQEQSFKRAAKLPNVEYVYLSKDMLTMVGGSLPVPGMDQVTAQLTSMEVLSTSNTESAQKAFTLLENGSDDMEKLAHITESNGSVDIYGIKNGDKLSEMLVMVMKDAALSAVMMKGTIDPEVIKGIAAEAKKK